MTILPEIEKRLPLFLRNDKNGYALAKALEAGMAIFTETLRSGLDIAQNPDEMPEWRLDMLAWELNCYYDYGAPVERKREWIREAESLFAAYGTRAGVIRALLPFLKPWKWRRPGISGFRSRQRETGTRKRQHRQFWLRKRQKTSEASWTGSSRAALRRSVSRQIPGYSPSIRQAPAAWRPVSGQWIP